MPDARQRAGAQVGAVVRQPPRLRAAHDRARRPLPVPHRRGSRARAACRPSWPCCPSSRAPSTRRRCRRRAPRACGSSCPPPGKRLRTQAEPLPRRPPRRAGLHPRRARLPAAAVQPVRRLAAGAGRLQLGPGQRAARHRTATASAGLPTDYDEPAHARRDAQLRAQAAGGEEHRRSAPRTSACSCRRCENHPYFLSVPIERDIDVALAARLAGPAAGRVPRAQPAA